MVFPNPNIYFKSLQPLAYWYPQRFPLLFSLGLRLSSLLNPKPKLLINRICLALKTWRLRKQKTRACTSHNLLVHRVAENDWISSNPSSCVLHNLRVHRVVSKTGNFFWERCLKHFINNQSFNTIGYMKIKAGLARNVASPTKLKHFHNQDFNFLRHIQQDNLLIISFYLIQLYTFLISVKWLIDRSLWDIRNTSFWI
jgi:hypothetical protein